MQNKDSEGGQPLQLFGSGSFRPSDSTGPELYHDFNFGSAQAPDPWEVTPDRASRETGVEGAQVYSSFWTHAGGSTDESLSAGPYRTRYPEVPGYQIITELGRGGMGVVYKAIEVRLNRPVALKMILAGELADADALRRLFAEAELIAQLRHPNIVQVYAIGDSEDQPFVALELVEGGSLASRLVGTPWAPRAAARLIETLARAVSAAHKLGIVHRDLKPGNILMTADGEPKVSDFGLAKTVEKETGLTRTESIVGSPCYMAPEQAEGHTKQVGPAADLYALGANLYELLTGRPPFVGPSVLATLELVRSAEPVPPRRLQPGLARDLETICLKCLSKEPGQRYESADALAEDLSSYLADKPIKARPTSSVERAVKWVRRRPSTAALVFVTTLAALAGVGVGVAHRVDVSRRQAAAASHIESLRGECSQFVALGQEALRRRDWETARTHFSSALAVLRTERALNETRASVEKMLALSRQRISESRQRQQERAKFAEFLRVYDEAVFYQSDYTGLDPEANVAATRSAARRALELFGLNGQKADNLAFIHGAFDHAELYRIKSSCYELLLILAEATVQPLRGENPVVQVRKALAILDEARQLRTPTPTWYLRRAAYLDRVDDHQAAAIERRGAETVPETDRSSIDDFLAGQQAYRDHDFKRAITAFRHVLMAKPDHFWAQYLLAICNLKSHRPAEAQASLIACQSQRPEFIWTYLLKGFAEGEMGEFDLAEADFERALALGPNDQERYVMLVNRGVMRIRRGQNEAAIGDLKAAIALKPNQFAAYVNLAQAYENSKDIAHASEALDQAIATAPEQPVLFHARSRLFRLQLRRNEALADLSRAIELTASDDPMLVADLLERGLILQQLGRYEEALAACDRAIALAPDRVDIHRLRGVVLVGLKRYDEAIHSFDLCLTKGTTSPALYEARGLALAWRGSYARAIADYTMALGFGHETSSLYENRGWAYLSSGAPELALRDFARALSLDAANAHALSGRALACVQLRKPQEAAADARALAQANPRDPRQLYNAARVFSLAAACLEGGTRQSPNAWANAAAYRTQAVDLIARAIELVPDSDRAGFWSDVVRTDAALDPIRRARKFLNLDARIAHLSNSRPSSLSEEGRP